MMLRSILLRFVFPSKKPKKQENQIHGPYCDERDLQRKQLACWKRCKKRNDRMTSLESTHDSPGHLLGPQDSKLVRRFWSSWRWVSAIQPPISQSLNAHENMQLPTTQPGPAALVTYDVQIMFTGSILIVRWEKIKLKSFRVMMIDISTVRSPFAIRHYWVVHGMERTSSAGNNTNYVKKRKEIRIPLRWWWLSTGSLRSSHELATSIAL